MRRNVIPAQMLAGVARLHDRLALTRRERDEARAHVERLRALLAEVRPLVCPTSPEESDLMRRVWAEVHESRGRA